MVGWFGFVESATRHTALRPPCGVSGSVGWFGFVGSATDHSAPRRPCGVTATVEWVALFSQQPTKRPLDGLAVCRRWLGGSGLLGQLPTTRPLDRPAP